MPTQRFLVQIQLHPAPRVFFLGVVAYSSLLWMNTTFVLSVTKEQYLEDGNALGEVPRTIDLRCDASLTE